MTDGSGTAAPTVPNASDLPSRVITLARDGTVLFLNGSFGALVADQTEGASVFDFAPQPFGPELEPVLEAVFSGQETRTFQVYVDAEDRWYEVTAGPMRRDGGVAAAVLTAVDISRFKRSDLARSRSENRLRQLLRAIPDMIFRLGRDGRFAEYSGDPGQSYVTPNELVGRRIDEVLPEAVAKRLQAALDEAFESRKPQTVQYQLSESGGLRDYEARIVAYDPSECLAIVRDVTRERETRAALATSEENFRAVIEQIPDIVLIHRQGTVLYVNSACLRLLQYDSADEVIGKSMIDFLHPDDREETVRRVRLMTETGRPLPARELRAVKRDGSILHVELAPVQRIMLPDGPASLVVARDRTQRKQMQERLLMADRMASMGKLAGGVAHEISNPLTYVMGNLAVVAEALDALWSEGDSTGQTVRELQKAVADALAGAQRVRDIIVALKAFSRPDVGVYANLDLRRVLDSAINMAWSEVRHRSRLVREYGETPTVRAAESRLGLVFVHLLVNAAQAIERGAVADNEIRVRTRTDGEGRAVVEIEDTGGGLGPEVQRRMFEPFFTTKPAAESSGLGLAICHSVVTSLGGEISGSSAERGAVFRVELPAVELSPDAPSKAEEASDAVGPIQGRILVVDDEPVIGSLVRRALADCDVYIMSSGRDALELCRELDFDVVICDLLMPDVEGVEIFEELVRVHPGTERRVIFMTAGAYRPSIQAFLDGVPNPVLDKPFDFAELRGLVRRVLEREGHVTKP